MSSSDLALLALHGLRLKGIAETATLAELLRVDSGLLDLQLTSQAERDLVIRRDTYRCGWALTTAGRAEHLRLLSTELDSSGQRLAVHACYPPFRPLNARLLGLCSRWQVRSVNGTRTLNDHADQAHDAAVLQDLEATDAAVQPLLAELTSMLDRFGIHGPRLTNALAAVRLGDYDWFASPLIDSYHTVWFELHEDLLVTLGLDRASETMATTSVQTT